MGYAGLASAVANAGGLGLVTALTQPTPEALAAEIDKAKAIWDPSKGGQLGVNLTILPMFAEVNYEAYKDVIVSSGLSAVETAGRPPGEFVESFQKAGMKVRRQLLSVPYKRECLTPRRSFTSASPLATPRAPRGWGSMPSHWMVSSAAATQERRTSATSFCRLRGGGSSMCPSCAREGWGRGNR